MQRRFDHIDLRVRSLREADPFYRQFLPLLGFTQEAKIDGWIQYIAESPEGVTEFFGVTEDPHHVANQNRIAFWAESNQEVDRVARELRRIGAVNIEGPGFEISSYYAVFFEDPFGNRFEICHRTEN